MVSPGVGKWANFPSGDMPGSSQPGTSIVSNKDPFSRSRTDIKNWILLHV